ncbi:MAG: hypothetical protein Q9172_001011 [Xanthocarpia lactea]
MTVRSSPSGSITHSPNPSSFVKTRLVARSAITLYPPAPSDPTTTLTRSTSQPADGNPSTKQSQNTSNPSSPTIPAIAFWAVLSALVFVLVLLALAFPTWYWLRGRHRIKPVPPPSSSSSSAPLPPNPWLSSPQSIQWPPFQPSTNSQPQHFSPAQMQQLHFLSQQLQDPAAPVAARIDPNRRALLARLAALNNPSILGAIAEDASTVLTSSSVYPGHERQVVNQHWADIKEKRLQEARDRGEVCEMEVDGGPEVVGKERKVRFREREWAVLASDGGGSRLEDIIE